MHCQSAIHPFTQDGWLEAWGAFLYRCRYNGNWKAYVLTRTFAETSVLIVGGSGRVGRMMIAHLATSRQPQKITLQTRTTPLSSRFESLHWDPLQAADPFLKWHAKKPELGSILVLAGATPGPNVDMDLNTRIAIAVLSAGITAGVRRVFLASSSAVYGPGSQLTEDAPLAPVNPYGQSKCQMERDALLVAKDQIDVTCLRIGNVAGADALLLNAAKATTDAPLQVDQFDNGGGPVRSYIGAQSLADAILTLAAHDAQLPTFLNVGTAPPVDMIDLAQAGGTPLALRPAPDNALQDVTLDCTQFEKLTRLPQHAGTPKELVRQWHATRNSL